MSGRIATRGAVPLALLLAAASGAAGLAHQFIWVRRMIDVLGADAGTFSRVIAAFFLGLSLGAFYAARRATPRPWASVARAEIAVAALAAVVFGAGQLALGAPAIPALAPILGWILPPLLIAPPAFAMGVVIPWMIRAVGPGLAVPLYAVNTLGGILGILLALGWALPALGLAGAAFFALSLNLGIAAVATWLARRAGPTSVPVARGRPLESGPVALTAFASGFLVLGAEVMFQHQLAQFLISSHYASAIVLALVLAALGIGALLVPAFARLGAAALPVALALAALAAALQPLVLVTARGGIHYLPFNLPLWSYLGEALRLGLPAVAIPLLPAALVFPLLLRHATARGVDAGHLLAINGLGGWLGAELSARGLAPMFGLWQGMAVLAGGYALCVLFQPGRTRLVAAPLAALAIAVAWQWNARLPYAGLARGDRLESVAVGREGVVAVVTGGDDDWRLLVNNTYTLGGSRAALNQERQALLPVLLHGRAERVATLGIATGSTLAGAALDPGVQHIEGIELSPLVLGHAVHRFAAFNRAVATDPRVTLTQGDARWIIGQRRGGFDVIAGDLFLPWNTGEGRLFTREHFLGVRAALRPGGLFCQWLPMYQLTRPQFDAILRTFREVFPEAWIVRGDFYVSMPIIALVGGRPFDGIDWPAVTAACNRLRAANQSPDPLLRHVEGVAMLTLGPAPVPPAGPTITLANAWLEWNAARNVIGQREPWFIGVPLAQTLREVQRQGRPQLPADLRPAQDAGDLCIAYEIARAARLPAAAKIAEQLRADFPAALLEDPGARWAAWPMRYPPPFLP